MKPLNSLGLKHHNDKLMILDQTRLPHEEVWEEITHPTDMISAIQALKVRGAPLIGVAAALSLAKYAESDVSQEKLLEQAKLLRAARPTAINLMWAMDRMTSNLSNATRTAEAIFDEDVALCESMASHGASLIEDGDHILTHCNTGGLATVGIGTALGVIRRAHESGKRIHVYVDETRPLLQGGRLTTWELDRLCIPFTLICDNMAGSLMRQGKINKVFLGADRIARNGDFANKIGTYSVAILAKHHQIPFYCVAPSSTFDANCPDGTYIAIEDRTASEVIGDKAPHNCKVYNPAFDVTPHPLVTATVLDTGIRRWI